MSDCNCNEKSEKKYLAYVEKIESVNNGPYWHNLVGMILRECANELGSEYANRLIDDLELSAYFHKAG